VGAGKTALLGAFVAALLYGGWSLWNPTASASETPPEESLQSRRTEGWISLFDGITLEGWEDPAKEDPPGNAWKVVDGCIKATPLPRLREDLYSLETFTDFELTFEWKIAPGGNSGVKYLIQDRAVLVEGRTYPGALRFEDRLNFELLHRTADRSRLGPEDRIEEYSVGFEYQLIDNERHRDALRGPDRTAGAVYSLVAPTRQVARPAGEFNQARIRLRDTHVEHWLNGVKVVDVDLASATVRKRLEQRWGPNSPVYRLLTELPRRRTPIALQHHNDEVWFRNLWIRRLDGRRQT